MFETSLILSTVARAQRSERLYSSMYTLLFAGKSTEYMIAEDIIHCDELDRDLRPPRNMCGAAWALTPWQPQCAADRGVDCR